MFLRDEHQPAARRHAKAGMTLVEVTCCVVIVGVMMVAALNTVGAAARSRHATGGLQQGGALARQIMAEVTQAFYSEPDDAEVMGPEPGEAQASGSRSAFDDADDYHGLNDSPPRGPDGAVLAGYEGWRRQVTVEYVSLANPSGAASATPTGLKRVAVTVTSPTGRKTTLIALRSPWSRYDQLPGLITTYITAAQVDIQIGTGNTSRASAGANLLNQIP